MLLIFSVKAFKGIKTDLILLVAMRCRLKGEADFRRVLSTRVGAVDSLGP